ncbi:MAG: RNA polymerase sigma-70 factor [Odoribacteraceae bacterium]|jgi:RNA polymerase sigma-70 factor (ECF subfamily)|nr:RNA polymerase sigma-70 factor [Odoribacteraceae bacterium]
MLTGKDEFKHFFQEHLEAIHRFARHYTGDGDVARDIAQEAFIRLHEQAGNFASREKARSFLYTTVRNGCLDYLRHQKIERQYSRHHRLVTPENDTAEDEEVFLHELTYQETARLLHAAIAQLPPRGRTVILHGMSGKNNTEIAEAMHVSVNTVKTLKKGAYAALRELLKHLLSLLF